MKISVVTVCRNAMADLRKTALSVAGQDYADLEFIVIDGGSTDGTPEYLRNCRSVDRYVSEADEGIYDAMNKGTALASGEWVVFMNAGDTFASPDTLSRLAESLSESRETPAVVYGDVVKKGADGKDYVKKAEEPHLSHRMIFCHQSAMTRREELLRHPYDTRRKLSADYKFFMTLLIEGKRFMRVDYPVSLFDTGGVSNRRRSAGLADNMRVILELEGLVKGLPRLAHLFPTWLISRLRGK